MAAMKDLISIINYLVDNTVRMKNEFTDAVDAPIEFACIFCQSNEEYKRFTVEIQKLGKIVQDTSTGFTYHLDKPLETKAGILNLVKIRKPDPQRKERGDTDFNTHYQRFKEKYENKPRFELVRREEFEMLRLSDPSYSVMVCFSSKPLSEVLGPNK